MPGAFDWLQQYEMTPPTPEEAKARQQALFGSVADLGGITSFVSNNLGSGEIAAEIARLKGQDPTGSTVADMVNPLSLGGTVLDAGKSLYDWWNQPSADQPPQAMTLDDFIKERSKPVPTVAEYEAQALDRVRNSPAYQQLATSRKKGDPWRAEQMLKTEGARAKKNYETDKARLESENASLPDAYKDYTRGINDQLETYYGQDFKDRNPGLSQFAAIAGPVAAALLTRGAFKGINQRMGKWGLDAKEAIAKGDIAGEAQALDKLKYWNEKGRFSKLSREQKAKGTALGLGAMVPLETQLVPDLVDKYALSAEYQDADGEWQRSRAQKTAADKLSDPVQYLQNNATSIASGILGAGYGAKFAGKSPADEAGALLNPGTPERYADMAKRRIAAIEADRAVAAAKAAPVTPPAPPPGPVKPPRGPRAKGPTQDELQAPILKGIERMRQGKPFSVGPMRGKDDKFKGRVNKGADTLGLTTANASLDDAARAETILQSGKFKLGLAGAATGYSAILAEKLRKLEEEKAQEL